MGNFTQMANSFAQQYIAQNCANNSQYRQVKAYVTQATQGEFIADRSTAFVGSDPNISGSSYVLIIEPTFKAFNQSESSHKAGSMVSYFADGGSSFVASMAVIDHDPYQIDAMTLMEMDTSGAITSTTVNRSDFTSLSVQAVAESLSTVNYESSKLTQLRVQPNPTDLAAIANISMGQFTSDSYAAHLYPTGALNLLLNDSSIPAMFSQAAALKTAANNSSLRIVCCTSTSCNGCSSCSSTIKLSLF